MPDPKPIKFRLAAHEVAEYLVRGLGDRIPPELRVKGTRLWIEVNGDGLDVTIGYQRPEPGESFIRRLARLTGVRDA